MKSQIQYKYHQKIITQARIKFDLFLSLKMMSFQTQHNPQPTPQMMQTDTVEVGETVCLDI